MTRVLVGMVALAVGGGLACLGWWGLLRPRQLLRPGLDGDYGGYRRVQLWELRIGGGLLLVVGTSVAVAGWFVPLPPSP